MSKFKLTQTAAEVQDILNNSLQKPTGLTKTELVGVGVNGQENIEIGDNLTLANGKLGVNGLESDAEGNLTASKNLKVDGKLTLKSLVSASNPDGDITKELGGGGEGSGDNLYLHSVYFWNSNNMVVVNIYNHSNVQFNYNTFKQWLSSNEYPCSGAITKSRQGNPRKLIPFKIYYNSSEESLACKTIDLEHQNSVLAIIGTYNVNDSITPVD